MEIGHTSNPHEPLAEVGAISFLDLIIVLLKRKKSIIAISFLMALFVFAVSFAMTPVYQGTARIIPPQTSSASTALLSQLVGASGALPTLTGTSPSSALYVGLAKSRTVCDAIIDQFGLMETYKVDRILGKWRSYTRDAARDQLLNTITVESDSTSGIITISVQDKDPKKAAEMANAFVAHLKKLLQRLAVTEAGQRRLFFEEQLKQTHTSLMKAEEALQGFRETTGAIQIEEQARAVLEGIAAIRAQIATKEIQLQVMKAYLTERNPDFRRTEEELNALREQLSKLEANSGDLNSSTVIPTGKIPNLGKEYIRMMREFKYNEALFELMAKQYEAAKLDEAKDAAIIQVVDLAVTPEKPIWPKRIVMILAGGILGFILAIFIAFFREYVEQSYENPYSRERLLIASKYLRRL